MPRSIFDSPNERLPYRCRGVCIGAFSLLQSGRVSVLTSRVRFCSASRAEAGLHPRGFRADTGGDSRTFRADATEHFLRSARTLRIANLPRLTNLPPGRAVDVSPLPRASSAVTSSGLALPSVLLSRVLPSCPQAIPPLATGSFKLALHSSRRVSTLLTSPSPFHFCFVYFPTNLLLPRAPECLQPRPEQEVTISASREVRSGNLHCRATTLCSVSRVPSEVVAMLSGSERKLPLPLRIFAPSLSPALCD